MTYNAFLCKRVKSRCVAVQRVRGVLWVIISTFLEIRRPKIVTCSLNRHHCHQSLRRLYTVTKNVLCHTWYIFGSCCCSPDDFYIFCLYRTTFPKKCRHRPGILWSRDNDLCKPLLLRRRRCTFENCARNRQFHDWGSDKGGAERARLLHDHLRKEFLGIPSNRRRPLLGLELQQRCWYAASQNLGDGKDLENQVSL